MPRRFDYEVWYISFHNKSEPGMSMNVLHVGKGYEPTEDHLVALRAYLAKYDKKPEDDFSDIC